MKKTVMILVAWFFIGCLMAIAGEDGAFTNLEKAIAKAVETKKDILVDFTGSDWCGWCIRLDKEVFNTTEWKEYAEKNLVIVVLDFPQEKELSPEQTAYNRKIAEEYQVEGFPTICLLNSEGKIYAKTGYQRGGPTAYIKHVQELAGNKEKIGTGMAKIESSKGDAKVQAIAELLKFADEAKIGFAYLTLKDEMIASDSENKKGYFVEFSEDFAEYYGERATQKDGDEKAALLQKVDAYLANVKKFDAQRALNLEVKIKDIPNVMEKYLKKEDVSKEELKAALDELKKILDKKPTEEAAQVVHYFVASIYYHLGQTADVIRSLESAIDASPKSPIAERLSGVLEKLKQELQQDKPEEVKKE